MPCYVDKPRWAYRRMFMCHLIADSLEELHEMADRIGIKRQWFQSDGSFPHYDICKAKRALAVEVGAQQPDTHAFVEVMRRFRLNHPDWREQCRTR